MAELSSFQSTNPRPSRVPSNSKDNGPNGNDPYAEDTVKSKIADRIRTARGNRGMSKAELARKTKVSNSAIGRWEDEENLPPLNQIMKVADALGYSLAWFLQDFDPKIEVAQNLSEGIFPVEEAGDRSEMAVRLRDLVEAAGNVQILVSLSGD